MACLRLCVCAYDASLFLSLARTGIDERVSRSCKNYGNHVIWQ